MQMLVQKQLQIEQQVQVMKENSSLLIWHKVTHDGNYILFYIASCLFHGSKYFEECMCMGNIKQNS